MRATSRIVSAGTPQTGAIASGEKPPIFSTSSAKPSVKPAMYCLSVRPSLTIVCSIALSSATSLPGLKRRSMVAWRDRPWPRGSATISLAPRLTAFLMKVAATGWFAVGLAPITKIVSASSAAENGAVTAPEPMPSNSAATDEAWQSRVQ